MRPPSITSSAAAAKGWLDGPWSRRHWDMWFERNRHALAAVAALSPVVEHLRESRRRGGRYVFWRDWALACFAAHVLIRVLWALTR